MIDKSQKQLNIEKSIKKASVEMKPLETPKKTPLVDYALCPKCGHKISIFYFTKTVDSNGNVLHTRCPNCGFFDSPE